jgi:tetratricopeptide (TPR) repeat protein
MRAAPRPPDDQGDLADVKPSRAAAFIGDLINNSIDTHDHAGLERAVGLGEKLLQRDMDPAIRATVCYFIGNAWAGLRAIRHGDPQSHSAWEHPEAANEILWYRRAMTDPGFETMPAATRCQNLTNLGNVFSHIGRFVEAIELWERALAVDTSFGMAMGNRGFGLLFYGNALYDDGQSPVFFSHAHALLVDSLKLQLTPEARCKFRGHNKRLWGELDSHLLRSDVKARHDKMVGLVEREPGSHKQLPMPHVRR